MALDFPGGAATDFLRFTAGEIEALLSGASAFSVAAKVNYDAITDASSSQRIFTGFVNGASTGFLLATAFSSPNNFLRLQGRSVSTDSLQTVDATTTNITAGVLRTLGGVWNIGGDAMRGYINGVQEMSGAATFANATYTPGTPTGQASIGITNCNGLLAELAIWKVDIGTAGMLEFHRGKDPRLISPGNLVYYHPGHNATDPDLKSGIVAEVVGTIAHRDPHPAMYRAVSEDDQSKVDIAADTSITLGISGTSFTINGTPTFLRGFSYFDGKGYYTSDLDWLKARNLRIIRVWLSDTLGSATTGPLIDPTSGEFRGADIVKQLLNELAARGMVADLTIMRGSAPTSSVRNAACQNVARALAAWPNKMYDLMNEHSNQGANDPGHANLKTFKDTILAEDATAIVFTSNCCSHVITETNTPSISGAQSTAIAAHITTNGEAVLSNHFLEPTTGTDPMDWAANVDDYIALLRTNLDGIPSTAPILYDETYGRNRSPQPTAIDFLTALTNAQAQGAGIIFYSPAGGALGLSAQTMVAQLDAVEVAFFDSLLVPAPIYLGESTAVALAETGKGVGLLVSDGLR